MGSMVQGLFIKRDKPKTIDIFKEKSHEHKNTNAVCNPKKGQNAIQTPHTQDQVNTDEESSL